MKKTRFHLCAACGSMPLSAQREKKSVCSSLRDLHTWREGIEREAEREAGIVPVSSEAGRWKGAIEGREIGNLRALHRRDGPRGSHGKEGLGPIPEVTRTGRRGSREGSEARTSASGTPPARSSVGCRQLVRQLARTGCFEVRLAGGMARKEDGFFFATRDGIGGVGCFLASACNQIGICKEVLLTPKWL